MADKASAAILDFTDVKDRGESGINKKRVPAGDYLARVSRVEDRPTKETKAPQWMYVIKLEEKFTDRAYPLYCKLEANQLWKLRNLFIACGVAIPKKKVKLDPNRIVGKVLGITLEDDEYDGKAQSTISQTFPANELDGGDTDDEENEDVDPEDEDEDEETNTEEPEDDEEEEPEPAPKKRAAARIPAQRKASPKTTKKAPVDDVDDDELDELDLDAI